MPRKRKFQPDSSEEYQQLELDFNKIINDESHKVFSRDEVADYNPVARTADYMRQIVESQRAWETTIKTAREHLLEKDPRELYLEFFTDLKRQIETDGTGELLMSRYKALVSEMV